MGGHRISTASRIEKVGRLVIPPRRRAEKGITRPVGQTGGIDINPFSRAYGSLPMTAVTSST